MGVMVRADTEVDRAFKQVIKDENMEELVQLVAAWPVKADYVLQSVCCQSPMAIVQLLVENLDPCADGQLLHEAYDAAVGRGDAEEIGWVKEAMARTGNK